MMVTKVLAIWLRGLHGIGKSRMFCLYIIKYLPERVRNIVMEFVKKCVEDSEFANIWASVQQTAVTSIELTEEECKGVEPYTTVYDEVVRDRLF